MTNEPSEQDKPTGCACHSTTGRCRGAGDGCGCGAAHPSAASGQDLKHLSKQFLDQPLNFAEAAARGWPGPYDTVEYSEADWNAQRQAWEQLEALERELGIRDENNRFTDEGS
jgi:hypothetical protein